MRRKRKRKEALFWANYTVIPPPFPLIPLLKWIKYVFPPNVYEWAHIL
jgi:hypothetical protein